jgi:hypothetical protein
VATQVVIKKESEMGQISDIEPYLLGIYSDRADQSLKSSADLLCKDFVIPLSQMQNLQPLT